jgi:hypothetical protein
MFIALGVILALIVALLAYAASRPADFRIQRSASIKAPPDRIAPLIVDFNRWSSWSPYEKLDPGMTRTLSGAASGKGAVYEWSGNNKAGRGRMQILDVSPSTVTIKLDFEKPFEAHNTALFTLEPGAGGTTVTWAMEGARPFSHKLIGVFMNMDQLVGRDFETGLANMKSVSEA